MATIQDPDATPTPNVCEEGDPRSHPEIWSQKVADFECRFPYDSNGKNRAPFWPFLGEGLGPTFSRPLCFTADLPIFHLFWVGEVNPYQGSLVSLTKGVKDLETALGAAFAPTRFSLVRISVRDLVQTEILTKKVQGWEGGSKSDP